MAATMSLILQCILQCWQIIKMEKEMKFLSNGIVVCISWEQKYTAKIYKQIILIFFFYLVIFFCTFLFIKTKFEWDKQQLVQWRQSSLHAFGKIWHNNFSNCKTNWVFFFLAAINIKQKYYCFNVAKNVLHYVRLKHFL